MSLHVLAYSMKRMIQIFGVGPLMAAIRPRSGRLVLSPNLDTGARLDRSQVKGAGPAKTRIAFLHSLGRCSPLASSQEPAVRRWVIR
jgi:hypothetical protein